MIRPSVLYLKQYNDRRPEGVKCLIPDAPDAPFSRSRSRSRRQDGRQEHLLLQVSCYFLLLVLIWFFEEPEFITGWSDYFTIEEQVEGMVGCLADDSIWEIVDQSDRK